MRIAIPAEVEGAETRVAHARAATSFRMIVRLPNSAASPEREIVQRDRAICMVEPTVAPAIASALLTPSRDIPLSRA